MTCLICKNVDAQAVDAGGFDGCSMECPNCGKYKVSGTLGVRLEIDLGDDEVKRALVSHRLRQMQRGEGPVPLLSTQLFDHIIQSDSLPDPSEQADLMVLHLGATSTVPQQSHRMAPVTHNALIGAVGKDGLHFIASSLAELGLTKVTTRTMDGAFNIGLTMQGWERYQQLMKGRSSSRKAFVAMKFGDPELDQFVNDVFRPAVEQAGFKLVRLDDNNPAGLIDDRLRVEIQTSKFLLADLTHGNNGAYWEAGYAEGLGKPVIYTCKQDAFDESGTHFDTNHHLTVMWDPAQPAVFFDRLKATIRATFPTEAKLEDT